MELLYQLDVKGKAKRELKQVQPDHTRHELTSALLELRNDPYPPNSELDRELHGRYRLKINGWRAIYKVNEKNKIVTVLTIRRRNRATYLNVP
ncbi:MAG: type II toxin-antitoxin system RelE/ParE family toxin [Caldilineaceae bacterium]